MHDKYKKRFRAGAADDRLRRQIAREAARRLLAAFNVPRDDATPLDRLEAAAEADYYAAKRKAAAVLGHRVRPGDLPSDDEVRNQVVELQKERAASDDDEEDDEAPPPPEPSDDRPTASLAETIDRFALYRLRLAPLEGVRQDPATHPEGDALYHSLQVFHQARDARPHDEDFLIAALLHDVGKAMETKDHAAAAVDSLRGAVSERSLWLIAHHMDLIPDRLAKLGAKRRAELLASEFADDLKLLRECDDAGREIGVAVESVDEALAYLRGLENETYLED